MERIQWIGGWLDSLTMLQREQACAGEGWLRVADVSCRKLEFSKVLTVELVLGAKIAQHERRLIW